MKVTLEKADLIQILAEHFGSDFDVENITIRSEPFEIEVRNVPLPPSEKVTAPATEPARLPVDAPRAMALPAVVTSPDDVLLVARRADADASVVPPPPGNDENDDLEVTGSPLSVLQQSRALEEQLKRDRTPRRRGGSATPPPYTSEET